METHIVDYPNTTYRTLSEASLRYARCFHCAGLVSCAGDCARTSLLSDVDLDVARACGVSSASLETARLRELRSHPTSKE